MWNVRYIASILFYFYSHHHHLPSHLCIDVVVYNYVRFLNILFLLNFGDSKKFVVFIVSFTFIRICFSSEAKLEWRFKYGPCFYFSQEFPQLYLNWGKSFVTVKQGNSGNFNKEKKNPKDRVVRNWEFLANLWQKLENLSKLKIWPPYFNLHLL